MSQKSKVIFAALAAVATLGAAQIAAGQVASKASQAVASQAASAASLADRFQAVSEPANTAGVNRAAKGDRGSRVAATAEARTVLLKVESLTDTSVLVRIPLQKDARNLPPAQPAARPVSEKPKRMTVACEPVVSVLTEVAKLLQPGKCVT